MVTRAFFSNPNEGGFGDRDDQIVIERINSAARLAANPAANPVTPPAIFQSPKICRGVNRPHPPLSFSNNNDRGFILEVLPVIRSVIVGVRRFLFQNSLKFYQVLNPSRLFVGEFSKIFELEEIPENRRKSAYLKEI